LNKNFRYGWYPEYWLLWYLYGAPEAFGHEPLNFLSGTGLTFLKRMMPVEDKERPDRSEHTDAIPNKVDRRRTRQLDSEMRNMRDNGGLAAESSLTDDTTTKSSGIIRELTNLFATNTLNVTITRVEAPRPEAPREELDPVILLDQIIASLNRQWEVNTMYRRMPPEHPDNVLIGERLGQALERRSMLLINQYVKNFPNDKQANDKQENHEDEKEPEDLI